MPKKQNTVNSVVTEETPRFMIEYVTIYDKESAVRFQVVCPPPNASVTFLSETPIIHVGAALLASVLRLETELLALLSAQAKAAMDHHGD